MQLTNPFYVSKSAKKNTHYRFPSFTLLLVLMTILFTVSCTKSDDEDDQSLFQNSGLLVVNEGPFQTGTGTIDFIDMTTGRVKTNLFSEANDGQILGNIAQSLLIQGDTTYIVVNNANKVVLVDTETFRFIGEIGQLPQARFIHVEGSTAYVSCWGDGFEGKIAVIDLNTLSETQSFPASGPEQFMKSGDFLFVTLTGGFGNSNKLGRIHLRDQVFTEEFTLSDRPTWMAQGLGNNQFYILCSGFNDFAGTVTKGALWKFENGQVTQVATAENGAGQLTFIPSASGELAWLEGNTLVKYLTLSESKEKTSLDLVAPRAMTAITFENTLAIADAVDFNSAGKVYLYDTDNLTPRDTFDVGIIPNQLIYILK